MTFRSHINLAVAIIGGLLYSAASVVFVPKALPFSDIPLSMVFILLGSGLTDIDLWWSGPGHRVNSFMHKLEAPWITGFLFFVLYVVPQGKLPAALSEIWQFIWGGGILLCAGWFLHLVGDFIEGGIGSYIFRGKRGRVGFTWFTWERYSGTWAGGCVDGLIVAGAALSLYFLFSTLSADTAGFFPGLVNWLTGWSIPLASGKVVPVILWVTCMMWSRGGFKGFFWRVLLTSFGMGISWYIYTQGLSGFFAGFSII